MFARSIGTLIAVFGVLSLCACSTNAGDSSASSPSLNQVDGLDLMADVDPDAGTVVLPADRFQLSENKLTILSTAGDIGITKCARSLGIPMMVSSADPDPVYDMWYQFGPWTVDMAERFAFVPPMTDADMVVNGIEGAPADSKSANDDYVPLPEDQLDEAIEKCSGDPDFVYFNGIDDGFGGPWQEDFNQVYEKTLGDPRAEKVFDDLTACYKENGMTFDSSTPSFVTAADPNRIDEDQVEMAVKVAQCQESTDSIQQLADIMAEYQAPTIEEYAEELVEIRDSQDEALAKAEDYIADNPDAFQPVQ
ncbi:hypothetical protein DD236_07655 [Ancrocorticia populi]|uniref:Uncharacterized protein n=2 Tax=Ancrocorticia populi TaxID=2175228 RepID=A0A2V1K3Z7_9ACTO|nr:hypothetical protein DD236_07655 [Ancrocorticia populi]